ncbi:uncharacterized protein A4U43_C01F2750 [Asparagus officinalis]|uniref:Uncharacterized protein n=1 Tax=Asparagus officinalis TaxID=4686 RepID=A0A5P1FQU3_ASPOF|nr:uncharacterized protein A4U43_C01F2750 [Asparagus officinalis]
MSTQTVLPVISRGVAVAAIPIPSKEEEEEESVDYSGEDDADRRLSPNFDSSAEDLTIISPLPTQGGTTFETMGEWRSLVEWLKREH